MRQQVDERRHRVQRGNDNAAQGHDAGDGKFYQKDPQQDGADQRLGGKRRTGTHQHALAALKAEKQRAAVSDHTENGSQIRPANRVQRVLPGCARAGKQSVEDKAPQPDGGNAFAHIAQRGQDGRQFAVGTQNVGHTGVSAAVAAHIIIVQHLGDQDAKQNAAQQVSAQRGQQAGGKDVQNVHNRYTFPARATPSPCSRVIIRMGVPVSPKVSRIWFSI